MPVLLEDDLGRPKPQYENQAGTDFEPWKGANGHGNVRSSDGQLVTIGARADSAAADHTVSASVVAVLKAILRDVGESPEELQELLDRMGEAVAEPDPHTQLARLQAIIDELGGLNTNVGDVEDLPELDPEASATLAQILKGLLKTQRDLLDPSGSLTQIDHNHSQIHRGNAFEMDTDRMTLTGDTAVRIHMQTGSKHMHLKQVEIVTKDDKDVYVRFYRDPTVSLDGDPEEIPSANSRDDVAVDAGTKFYTNSDITAVGDVIPGRRFWVPGQDLIGQSVSKGGAGMSWEKVFAPNSDYVLELQRETGATESGTVRVRLLWYEAELPSE